jgi:NTE family protein
MAWSRMQFDPDGVATDFPAMVVEPVRALAATHVDVPAVVTGVLSPWKTIGERVSDAYAKHVFGDATLQALPDHPRFTFNSTNLASGALMRFTKQYVVDWRVGRVAKPETPLAVAVACSSAFPPFLSPYHLDMSDAEWTTDPGNDLTDKRFRGELRLSDGGVYDNLGIETVWKSCSGAMVSDAGGQMAPDADPPDDWARHILRVLNVIDHQVRSLRKRQVIAGLESGQREGTYVGIRSHVADYHLDDCLPADPAVTDRLARLPTRLDAVPDDVQERLVNWGYVICDTGLRKHVETTARRGTPPYPAAPLTP